MGKPRKVIIFGTNKIAECALAFFRDDGIAQVAALTVDSERLDSDEFCGLPVVPYEEAIKTYPSETHQMFVAVGYSDMNRNRDHVMKRVKSDGYSLASCISPRSIIMPGVSIGENAFIFHGCTIDPYVKIGDGVLIGSNSTVGHHCVIEDHCYIAYGVVIAGSVKVGHHSILGCNSTVGASATIGAYNFIGDGSLVCRSTNEKEVYIPVQTPKAALSSDRAEIIFWTRSLSEARDKISKNKP